jgi:hypothetical protein
VTIWIGRRNRLLLATALFTSVTIAAQAQYPNNGGALAGGILGIIGGAIQQQQQLQLQQQQQQQWQQQQQQTILRQQQIEADHQRAVSAAQTEAARQQAEIQRRNTERQQAAADVQRAQQQAAAKAATEAKAKADKLRADPALATIMGTDGQDITVLMVGADTPNIIRNLKGDPIFQNKATACLPFGIGGIDARFLADVKARIEQKGGANSSLLLTSCNPADLAGYEIIAFSRGQVAGGTLEVLEPLVTALRNRQFVALATYAIADFKAAEIAKTETVRREQRRQEAERLDALKSFQERDPTVISAIHTESPAALVCIASNPDPEGVRYMLRRTGSPFAGTITPTSVLRDPLADADTIFVAFKRKECTAAVAPAGILRDVMAGLIRDGFKVEVDAGVITSDQLANWKVLSADELADAQQKQKDATQQERLLQTKRQAERQDQQKLDAQRRQNDEATRREELERVRQLVTTKATAVTEDLGRKIQKHIASVTAEVDDTKLRAKTRRVLSPQEQADQQTKYASDRLDFDTWPEQVATLVKQGWEFSAPKVGIEDYGRAQWKQRTIEAITVKMEFPIVNRVIGERKTVCDMFTFINDEEFQFLRQMQMVPCEDYEHTFATWAQENSFVSQWKLLEPSS